MGTLYDPLQIMSPYSNNLKLIYRDLTRMIHVIGDPQWDKEVPPESRERILKALSYFFSMEDIQFRRKAIFMEASEIIFKIFLDGSIGVSVIKQNV